MSITIEWRRASRAAIAGGVLIALGAVVPACAQNADPQLLTLSCSGCHGPGGHSPGAIPSLSGRSAETLAEILRHFRDGKRPATVMDRIAKGYSDAEIDVVAREIASNWK